MGIKGVEFFDIIVLRNVSERRGITKQKKNCERERRKNTAKVKL